MCPKILAAIFFLFLGYELTEGIIYEHHMISRQQLVNRCFQRYISMVESQCTYPEQEFPCLNGTKVVNGKQYASQVYEMFNVLRVSLGGKNWIKNLKKSRI